MDLPRIKFLLHESATLPNEEEQLCVYHSIAQTFDDKPVIIHTLDIDGNEPLPLNPPPVEDNPFLRLRGIRSYLAHPQIFILRLCVLPRTGKGYPIL